MRRRTFSAVLLAVSLAAGCADDSGPTAPAASTFPQTLYGTVSASDNTCTDYSSDFEFPCRDFEIVSPRSGTLVTRLSWSDPGSFLLLGSPYGARFNWLPCSSGCESRIGVVRGGRYALYVGLDTRRSANPSQAFQVTLSFE